MARYITIAQIADYFGIDRTTFYEILKRQPEVFLHYKKGRAIGMRSSWKTKSFDRPRGYYRYYF
jgi:predicted DNA-binding transcriptional regulator AlpA